MVDPPDFKRLTPRPNNQPPFFPQKPNTTRCDDAQFDPGHSFSHGVYGLTVNRLVVEE